MVAQSNPESHIQTGIGNDTDRLNTLLSTLKMFWDQTKTETGINVRSYRNQKNKPPNAKMFLL